jgi:response regulator RpfG family c-di-GMP phosphodiesterase
MGLANMERTILLVDDEANILSALTRLLRPAGYRILRAGSGREGLELLAQNQVGVILSDQRMPEMTGVEFLRKVLELYPDTVRMVLSGYTELNSVTDAINRGAVYRFLTKPWDDELLCANIEEAFQRYEMKRENARLAAELKTANEALEQKVEEKSREVTHGLRILEVSQEVLENLPVAVLGIGADGMVALANRVARDLFQDQRPLLGEAASEILPPALLSAEDVVELPSRGTAAPQRFRCWREAMGKVSASQGSVLVLVPERSCPES